MLYSHRVDLAKEAQEEFTFPCLLRYGTKDDKREFILLAIGYNVDDHGKKCLRGIVVSRSAGDTWALGNYSDKWVTEYFVPYYGKVVLESKP